ncbi:hypothetical protein PCK1_001753 [Pneumocystis canis]|nr:hypothetical protein PCK1_001753 [Pneumocystis canis]
MLSTFVQFLGYSKDHCGYCNSNESNKKGIEMVGLWAYKMDCKTYELLLSRGWRRSGQYIYKPNGKRSCCVLYTIRLDAQKFLPKKSHKKALQRLKQYIWGEKRMNYQSWNLYDAVHESETDRIFETMNNISIPVHTFKVTFESSVYTDEKYELYINYQTEIHKETLKHLKKENFIRFLCDTPLMYDSKTGYGSFHQCYRLDGKLIAMAVIDILPGGVSSVYFMYESNVRHLCLGKVSVCREVSIVQERKSEFYYMGFYIHNHQKMRYKGEYRPSKLLDPETYDWVPIEKYLEHWKMGGSLYVSFCSSEPVSNIPLSISSVDSFSDNTENNEISDTQDKNDSNSLFDYDMPGILKEKDVQCLDLEKIYVLENKMILPLTQSVYYQSKKCVKRMIAESAAAVGIELVKKLCFVINV